MTTSVPAPAWTTDLPDLTGASSVPAHARIERWLTDLIGRGDLVVGDRLPPEGQLAAILGVSRMTLRQALGRLETVGTVQRKPGRMGGTFVDEPKILCDLTGLAGFTEQMQRNNVRAGARIVSVTSRPTFAVWLSVPLTPVIVNRSSPSGVPAAVCTVSVVLPGVAKSLSANAAVLFAGKPSTFRWTGSEKPFTAPVVTV